MSERFDVGVIGGGQAALAVGYYLRRTGLRYTLIDDQPSLGGAWRQTWPSLRLFSPPHWSSLPGWLMPRVPSQGHDVYPARDEVIEYLAEYERRYAIPVMRPVRVMDVRRSDSGFHFDTSAGPITTRALGNASGTWANPLIPALPGVELFSGRLLHSAHYTGPTPLAGRRVIVVGGGNSGAQLVAELSLVARVTLATREPPTFLPDDVDGRYLFEQATARYRAVQERRTSEPSRCLGDVVVVPAVKDVRARGALDAKTIFVRFTTDGVVWPDGREQLTDEVIFATGFRAALEHLSCLDVVDDDGRVHVGRGGSGTQADVVPDVWLVGYGEWTGFASATLIGVGRSARSTVGEIEQCLRARTNAS